VLKGLDVEKMRERENVLVVYADVIKALGVQRAAEADRARAGQGRRVSQGLGGERPRAVSWSDDNKRVYFGAKPQVPVAEARRRSTDEVADVDIWNTNDERIQSQQMIAPRRTATSPSGRASTLRPGRFIKLTDETMREIDIALTGHRGRSGATRAATSTITTGRPRTSTA
jgi:hypothetical protein